MIGNICLHMFFVVAAWFLIAVSTATGQYSGGNGTPEDPFQIATPADLVLLGTRPEDCEKNFILTAGIDLDPNLVDGRVFDRAVVAADINDVEPGFQGYPFLGHFDGNGHAITHLRIEGDGYLGLFGRLGSGAIVNGLCLDMLDVNGIGNYVGGLVGYNDGGCVDGCQGDGTVYGDTSVGGLVGYNDSGSVINSHGGGTIRGVAGVGGLVGSNWGSVATSGSASDVTGNRYVGNLVGYNGAEAAISASCGAGVAEGTTRVGGLAGANGGNVTSSYSTASVVGTQYVGGLLGHNAEGAIVFNGYSAGTVRGENRTGGFVGANDGSITACYSVAALSGQTAVGGFAGADGGEIATSFWDVEVSGLGESAGGLGLTTQGMQDLGVYLEAGWDFVDESANGTDDIWRLDESSAYPSLWWEPVDAEAPLGVYRLVSAPTARHFYTLDEVEREGFLGDTAGTWEDEGVAFYAFSSGDEPNTAPVYRFYAASLDSYFYTISERERDKLVDDFADVWTYQTIAFYAFADGSQPVDAVPVYRFWSDVLNRHFYTIDEGEKNRLVDEQADLWTYEGVAWYAYAPPASAGELQTAQRPDEFHCGPGPG